MKPLLTSLLIALLALSAEAQLPSTPPKASPRAEIEGFVTKALGGEPVKKALIELIAENQSEGGDYTALSGADGSFHIEGIVPGRYRLFVERTGLLEVTKHHAQSDGRVLTLTAGQEIKDLQIRLQAAAVVRGRVTDEDGEPLPNAQVAVLHQTFASGRSHWEQSGAERTNDLGEYRVANLPAGNYYVSVTPPPDFKSLIEGASAASSEPNSASANEKPASASYQTTYFPGTAERSQAAPIQLRAGDEFPINFSLTPSPSLSIRGSVVNLPARSSAAIMVQSHDFNLVLNGAEMHKDGTFIIRDVAPGTYTILATVENSAIPMMARQSLQVSGNNVDDLRLAPQPGGWIHGRLRVESKSGSARLEDGQIFLALHPIDGDEETLTMFLGGAGFNSLIHVAENGFFEWKGVPPGTYYVELAGNPGSNKDWFLKSVDAGGHNTSDSEINVNGGAVVVDLVASANGAVVDGIVADDKGQPVANAVIVAVPDARLRSRVDRYRKTVSDQSGHFTLHGVPPGNYTVLAWESVEGDAYYNADFVKTYEAQGSALRLTEGERKNLQLQAIPEAEDQQ